jgi:hypothetical protein
MVISIVVLVVLIARFGRAPECTIVPPNWH